MRLNFQKIQWAVKALLVGLTDISWVGSLGFTSFHLHDIGVQWLQPAFAGLETWLSQPGWFGITPNILLPFLAQPGLTEAIQNRSLELTGLLSVVAITYLFVSLRTFVLSKDLPHSLAVWQNTRRINRLERQIQSAAELAETIEIMEMGRTDRNRVFFNVSMDMQRIYQQLQES